jgi:succinyl-CoA synthetase alpha subunit
MIRGAVPRSTRVSSRTSLPLSSKLASAHTAPFSSSARQYGYEDTINNLKIGKHTRVLYQGFTGRQATMNAKESIEYGTKVVGGVKPGVTGEHLGLPVLPSVREAVQTLKPDASAIYVPGNGTVTAMEEAIENEIPLIVAVAEHIPLHDIMRIHQMLRTQSKTRLVGANCPGIISTHGRCRLGFQPLPFFKEGNVGIVAKSGTLSYEAVASTTRAGLGQTYGISMGGDVFAGTNFVEAFQVLVDDPNTEGIIMIGELGGRAELDAAEWVKDYRKRSLDPKPFMACIGGVEAPPGRIMGHAGAWSAPGEAIAREKIAILEKADIEVVDHPEKFGERMKALLSQRGTSKQPQRTVGQQKRGYHTMRQRPRTAAKAPMVREQKRTLYIKQSDAFKMLNDRGIKTASAGGNGDSTKMVAISIDRSERQPCIVASPVTDPDSIFSNTKRFPFAYGSGDALSDEMVDRVANHMNVHGDGKKALRKLLSDLVDLYMGKEAFILRTEVEINNESGDLEVNRVKFGFDDAAFKSSKRQQDVHALRDINNENPAEVSAEKEGMVYVKLDGEGSIGTIVNGAGLAMNTVDNIVALGGHPANFLDTGGKATSETVKASFKVVTSDPRVKVIFVNIFGGLTLGDMIANGILMAFKDLDLKVPVVVRIRGTNEAEGQKLISESGLKMDAFGECTLIGSHVDNTNEAQILSKRLLTERLPLRTEPLESRRKGSL